jgi:hypothetical protein
VGKHLILRLPLVGGETPDVGRISSPIFNIPFLAKVSSFPSKKWPKKIGKPYKKEPPFGGSNGSD